MLTVTATVSPTPGPPAPTPTPVPAAAQFRVRAFYTETDAGHVFGPFQSRSRAEQCLTVLAARPGVVGATLEAI